MERRSRITIMQMPCDGVLGNGRASRFQRIASVHFWLTHVVHSTNFPR